MSWEDILKNEMAIERELLSVIESFISDESDFSDRNARRLEKLLRRKFATNRVYVGFERETSRQLAGLAIEINDDIYRYDVLGRLKRT